MRSIILQTKVCFLFYQIRFKLSLQQVTERRELPPKKKQKDTILMIVSFFMEY